MTNSRYTIALAILFGVLSFLSACANTDEEAQTDLRSAADADPSSQDGETLSPDVPNEIIGPGDDLPEELQVATREWTGDLDGMVERGYIRALVVYNRTGYFLDGPQQKGITYEALKEFEKFVNQKLKLRRIKLELYFLPVRRDELLRALTEGSGDLAAANLTITPERHPIRGRGLPVLGRLAAGDCGSGFAAAVGLAAGAAAAGLAVGLAAGAAGALPVTALLICSLTTTSSSLTMVAVSLSPFLSWYTVLSWPSTMNFCQPGTTCFLVSPFSWVICTVLPTLRHTVPRLTSVVVTVSGLVTVVIVRLRRVPGFSSCTDISLPLTMNRKSSGTLKSLISPLCICTTT